MVAGLLVAAVKEAVMANVKAVQLAGLNPVEVDLLPFALSRALGSGARSRGVVAIVDVGAATTNVLITIDGVPQFARIIPAGGEDLTQALAAKLDITTEEAERYKRTLGLASGKVPDDHRVAVETIYEVTANCSAAFGTRSGTSSTSAACPASGRSCSPAAARSCPASPAPSPNSRSRPWSAVIRSRGSPKRAPPGPRAEPAPHRKERPRRTWPSRSDSRSGVSREPP